ncbi:MAG: sensor domain-containing diguanylate cyclase [Nitrospirae bacterium]|nr:sensor domain-containing diguanylate cyclase [Nitrospirota bacterium]
MPKIFLIGKNLDSHKELFLSRGYEVRSFTLGQKKVIAGLDKADILVIDNASKGVSDIIRSSADIPKLVVSFENSKKSLLPWLKKPFSFAVHKPSAEELIYHVNRILREKELYKKNLDLKSKLNIVTKELSFFEEINKVLTSSIETNKILVLIMKKLKDLTKAEAWSILMVDEETGDLVFEKTEGRAKKTIKKFRLKPGEGIAGWVAKEGIPVVVPDVSTDKRFCSKIDRETHFNTKSLMCVPIKSKGKTIAVLEVINKKTGEPFNDDDLNLLLRLTSQTALALERTSLYQKMEELVVTDDLTKLFNTRYLNRTIETEVIRSNRYHSPLSLIFMDIDYFKLINDNYGHLVGSKVLVEMGQILINQLRTIDIVARYGGDEFVIVLPQTNAADAVIIAERIRKAIEQNTFLRREGYSLKVTSSFGVAAYPESAKTKEDLLRVADEAMYRVKHTTRNGVFAIV